MGGRRSYSVNVVVGSKRKLSKEIRNLKESIRSQESKKIAENSAKLITKSDYSIKNLSLSVKLLDFVLENAKKDLSYEYRKKISSKAWSDIKKEQKIETPRQIDRIFVNSAAFAIKRRKKK